MRAQGVAAAKEHLAAGRFAEALELVRLAAEPNDASHSALAIHAQALAALGREDEALKVWKRATSKYPTSGVAYHNCAVMEERLGRFSDAVTSARRGIALGLDAPETWAVLARALQGDGLYDEAEEAYREALRRRPVMADVQRDLAQLVWMRTADVDAATGELRRALATQPGQPELVAQLAKALSFGGREEAAYALLVDEIGRTPTISAVMEIAAFVIVRGLKNRLAALAHAERAVRAAPENAAAVLALCDAKLALGQAAQVARVLEHLHRRLPFAQQVTARLATAWRLEQDPRYHDLHDYSEFVWTCELETPAGWPSGASFVADLAAALRQAHTMRAHPYDQSLRNGTQTYSNLHRSESREIRAFFDCAEACVQRFVERLREGSDAFRGRNTGAIRVLDAWSVEQSMGGSHVNHVHQNGWISAVFYVDLPPAVSTGMQGWLKLGEPGIDTQPTLEPDLMVKPQVGQLVMFPSYFWHGTTAFTGAGKRLTIAFDVVPKK